MVRPGHAGKAAPHRPDAAPDLEVTAVAGKARTLPAERSLAILLDGGHFRLFRVEGEQVEELRDVDPPPKEVARPRARSGGARTGATRRRAHSPARADYARAAASPATPAATRADGRPLHARRSSACTLPVMGVACDHVHDVADRVAHLARAERIDRILAGGAPECVAELRHILRARLGGDIEALPLSVHASAIDVGQAARDGPRAEPTSREQQILGELIEGVGRGLAALGAAAVAEAVNDHRASLLIIPRYAGPSGAVCPDCGALFAAPAPAACPACACSPVPAPDFLERLARLVREHGGDVEEINGPAGETLRAYGGLAALLRYAFPGAGRTCPWADRPRADEHASLRG